MSKNPNEYLKHILDEINFIENNLSKLDESSFMKDETKKRAFVRSLEVIGEAIKNLPQEFTKKHSQIDWKSMAGLRDKLIHHYFGVDYQIVWDVVKTELPSLKSSIRKIIVP